MPVFSGLDRLANGDFAPLRGKTIGVVCHQASLTRDGVHILDHLLPLHRSGALVIAAVFGPQHGIWGHTQDNMVEWEGYEDPRTGLRFYSLYGKRREPEPAQLQGIDLLVFDLFDVGSRYYTFLWTLALCMKACEPLRIPLLVLDRPNPIGGTHVEGTVGTPEFASFVGLHPLPMRHGMTIGEIGLHFRNAHYPLAQVEVVSAEGWTREMDFGQFGRYWPLPSPNMPSPETALVYPGGCLLEGTNLSEGRGTTRPFEMVGAPWIDGWAMADRLNRQGLSGVFFRPIQFLPTFQKHAGEVCEGVFVHVADAQKLKPVLVYVAIIKDVLEFARPGFAWKSPPYEYEEVLAPFDILAGNAWLRASIENGDPLQKIEERMLAECAQFEAARRAVLLYGESP